MKKIITVIGVIMLSLSLISCKKESYETFKDQHLTAGAAFKQSSEEYYLYFYSKNCPHCNNVKKYVFKQAKNTTMPLYFINNRDVEGLLTMTDDPNVTNFGATRFSDLELFGFPTLLLLRHGRVIGQFVGSEEIKKELG